MKMMLYNHGYGSLQFKSLLFLFIISYCVAHNLINFQYFQKRKKKKGVSYVLQVQHMLFCYVIKVKI